MLEAAVADSLFPEVDGTCATSLALRRASLFAGRLLRHSWRGERQLACREARALQAELSRRIALPPQVYLRVPEGYAFYALYPETFLEAAGQFARTSSPGTAVCIGLLGDRFLPERLPFYRITYLASRLGYASFSTE
jgi:hypothetical protein